MDEDIIEEIYQFIVKVDNTDGELLNLDDISRSLSDLKYKKKIN